MESMNEIPSNPCSVLGTCSTPEGIQGQSVILGSDLEQEVSSKSDAVSSDLSQVRKLMKDDEETPVTSNVMTEVSPSRRVDSPAQGPLLPILQKIIDLSSKVQNLKREHSVLSHQVKSALAPNSDVVASFGSVGKEYVALQKRMLVESLERKRLYNEIVELKGNIRVFCRCRPLNQAEVASGSSSAVEFDPSQESELQIVSSDASKKHFRFDRVFKPEDNQETVFAETKPIITSVLDGYNVCIFAYGQTGTGKTFTMEGNSENRGVNYRGLDELFEVSRGRSSFMKFTLSVSMLEVYNDKIRDLLAENSDQNTKRLEIKQASDGSQEVPGLVETVVSTTEEVWELLKIGNKTRSVGATGGNELSSRSHCLVRVTVKGHNLIDESKTKSHLWLVDLAGSERVGKIEVDGERLKESQFINKSLSALGDVISALASKTGHIPYRNSKLTHILQSSLGGDCKTLMFVQISPGASDIGETICSLNFATRVRGIENGPARKNTDLSELQKYKQMVEKLKRDDKETKKLQDNVRALQLSLTAKDHVCRTFQEKVKDLEHQLAEERKARLRQEQRFATTSQARETVRQNTEKKPPIAPLKVRQPLRKISNFGPPQVTYKQPKYIAKAPSQANSFSDKENAPRMSTVPAALMQPRRASMATKPLQSSANQLIMPRKRFSLAVPRSEMNFSPVQPSKQLLQPRRRVSYAAPLNASVAHSAAGKQSLMMPRRSNLFTPSPDFMQANEVAATPLTMRSSQKFGQMQPRYQTVVALQRKALVWSPLKLKTNQQSQSKLSQFSHCTQIRE